MKQLEKLGLTDDKIFAGEVAEFTPVKPKPVGEKRSLYDAELVDPVINAYATDLLAAYEELEELRAQVDEYIVQIEEFESREDQYKANDEKIRKFEQLMSGLESSMNEVQEAKQADLMRINQLTTSLSATEESLNLAKNQVDEVKATLEQTEQQLNESKAHVDELEASNKALEQETNEMRETVEDLRTDVNEVLDGLQAMMEDEGLVSDDYDDSSTYDPDEYENY